MKYTLLIALLFLLPDESYSQDYYLSKPVAYDAHLQYAVSPATLDSLKEPLEGFFKMAGGNLVSNEYWIDSDFEKFSLPYIYLFQYFYMRDPHTITPYVMSIEPDTISTDYLARVAYIRSDSTVTIDHIYFILLTKNADGVYKLKHPIDYLTRNWERHTVNKIEYIVTPERDFNERQAQRMDSFSIWLANYFEMKQIPFKYYSCGNLSTLYLPQGEDNMYMTGNYKKSIGGNALTGKGKIVFSGNNSEYYPHELVHIYVDHIINDPKHKMDVMAMEGICTYLGGSSGQSLSHHLSNLADYCNENNINTINDILSIPGGYVNYGETSITYTLGGLVAKLIDKKHGLEGIIELMKVPQNELFVHIPKALNIDNDEINSYMMNELMKYQR